MKIVRTNKAASTAIPLSVVKEHLRVTGDYDDRHIATLLNACVDHFERETWRTVQETSFTAYLDDWDYLIEFKENYPVSEITSVKYYDASGTLQTMSTSDYDVDLNSFYPRIVFRNTYTLRDANFNNIEIAFKAGYANRYKMPDEISNCILMMVKDAYDHGGTTEFSSVSTLNLPTGLKRILANLSRSTPC